MRHNMILDTDSYKLSHWQFYPPGLKHVYSYLESRGGKYDQICFFGLQGFLKRYLLNPVTREDVEEAQDFVRDHGFTFNKAGWDRIVNVHGGFLPLRIKAAPEGTIAPYRNVMLTVENTDSTVPWLTSYVETPLLRPLWYGSTVATRILEMKNKLKPFFDETSDSGDMSFALLDFSSRGCSSYETNEIGGAAYLAHFLGSDSVPAVRYVNNYYGSPMAGFSVPALEHSVTTSWGNADFEDAMLATIIEKTPPNGIVSLVGDTYNIFEFAKKLGKYVEEIRNKNITAVLRPDSGEIDEVLPDVLRTVADNFGVTSNSKTFAVINNAKVLWGDGINEDTVVNPFVIAKHLGISAGSVMTGSGGGLMQANIDRDTCKWAFKASNVQFADGVDVPVAKDPITDPGKKSKMGRLKLITDHSSDPFTIAESDPFNGNPDLLRTVYENGKLLNVTSIDDIRERITKGY